MAAADRILERRFSFFGYPEVRLAEPLNWNHDPVSDVTWPVRPASKIDHRTADGDVKWIWELNRLQHLPLLAEAWLFTGDDRYAEEVFAHLDSWMVQCPPGEGIAWRGAFEAGVRAISVAVALQGVLDSTALTLDRYRTVASMLAESARRCWEDRSRFSSANNHLIGEMAGLATIAMLFPDLPGAARGERRALRVLAAEADRQILPDGAGAEQAVGYQVFTVELMWTVMALLRRRGDNPPASMVAAVERSRRYLAALIGEDDPAPRYGDDDEGFALRLGPEPVRTVGDHVSIVGGDSKRATAVLTSAWLEMSIERPRAVAPASLFAEHGGLVVLRSGRRRVTVDVGPLGYLSIAAHGHADALAVTLSVDGADLIGDPGAGSYYGHPTWRAANRGTRSHATVVVDGVDQSQIGGPFLWTHHANVRVRSVDLEAGIVDAEHDGYTRLSDPVIHRRWVVAAPHLKSVLVTDLLYGPGEHDVCVSWPLHPRLERDGGPSLDLAAAATVTTRSADVRGDTASDLGWWSERLEQREPSWLLGTIASGALPMVFATVLTPRESTSAASVEELVVERDGSSISVRWRGPDGLVAVEIDALRDGAAVLSSTRR
ncbi:heparinase II/III family protein [Desertimonas flava]|uniref:heparinase II/III family protein n=1 Tax=Desertimonas flava TaxID=2064846 RepID=UPI001968C9F0|nr:alginate lyase family protein [Desertimonas flava]